MALIRVFIAIVTVIIVIAVVIITGIRELPVTVRAARIRIGFGFGLGGEAVPGAALVVGWPGASQPGYRANPATAGVSQNVTAGVMTLTRDPPIWSGGLAVEMLVEATSVRLRMQFDRGQPAFRPLLDRVHEQPAQARTAGGLSDRETAECPGGLCSLARRPASQKS